MGGRAWGSTQGEGTAKRPQPSRSRRPAHVRLPPAAELGEEKEQGRAGTQGAGGGFCSSTRGCGRLGTSWSLGAVAREGRGRLSFQFEAGWKKSEVGECG